jgi:FkbM family methyltransferase
MNYEIFTRYLKDDSIVLEAGCFDGTNTIDLSNVFNKGHIYGLEPVHDIFKALESRVVNRDNISIFEMALDDMCGDKEMYISSGMSYQSSSLLKPKEHLNTFPDCKFETTQIVKTITINEFVKQNNINNIDFMWLDLQGSEAKVLSQADLILPTVKAIYSEYSLKEFYEGITQYEEFKKYMGNLGFKEVYNQNCFNYLGCGDSLFIREY